MYFTAITFFNFESWRRGNNSVDLSKPNLKLAEGKEEKQIYSTKHLKDSGSAATGTVEVGLKKTVCAGVRHRRTG